MEKIEVGYNPIATALGVSNHKFVVYTRSDGRSFQIHGGGSNDAGFSPLDEIASSINPSNVETGGFGFLNAMIFKTVNDEKLEAVTQRETVFEGHDLSATFFRMAGMAQAIAEQKSPYDFLANNSNTLVDRIVKWSGGSALSRDSGINAPGSLPDREFDPAHFGKLPPPIRGIDLYTRHSDVMSGFIENGVSGELFEPMPETPAGPVGPDPEQGNLHEIFSDNQAARPAKFGTEDDADFHRMAEEVFSSLTIDDWAVIHDHNDPFDNHDPFADGVKWVPGLRPMPANPWSG